MPVTVTSKLTGLKVEYKTPAEVLRGMADHAAFHPGDGYFLEDYDAGGLPQIVEEYSRLRTNSSRERYCRSVAYGLQGVDALPAGLGVRREAAREFRAYLDARLAHEGLISLEEWISR